MRRQRSSQGGAQSSAAQPMRKTFSVGGMIRPVAVLAIVLLAGLASCSSRDPAKATSDPLAMVRLQRVLKFYGMYTTYHQNKPPPNEQAFKEYLRTLPQEEKVAAGIVGDDVDSLLVSPRDGQKYHIDYGVVARPMQNRALAWEETGQDGKRYVALSNGYVKECDEETFQQYKPKK